MDENHDRLSCLNLLLESTKKGFWKIIFTSSLTLWVIVTICQSHHNIYIHPQLALNASFLTICYIRMHNKAARNEFLYSLSQEKIGLAGVDVEVGRINSIDIFLDHSQIYLL